MPANKALRQAADRIRGRLGKPDYALPGGEYACKKCGTPIQTWKTVGFRPDGSEMVAKGPNSSYIEVEFDFEDGEGKHITSLCKKCARNLSGDELEAIYVVDLERLADIDTEYKIDWSTRRNRKPRSVTRKAEVLV